MRKNIITVLIAALVSVFILNSCKDKDDNEENPQNQPPVIKSITADEQNITWNSTSQICVKAVDPEGSTLSYFWSSSHGAFITPTDLSCVTWKAPASSGSYKCFIHIADGTDTVIGKKTIYVSDPPFLFKENFSEGSNKWTFGGCDHKVENEILSLISTDPEEFARAQTYVFSPYAETPWSLSGEMAISGTASEMSFSGISVHLKNDGPYAIEDMWFAVKINDESINWAWLIWVPSVFNQWAVWDDNCYGASSYIYIDTQTNYLEMSVSHIRQFTLTANGHVLLANDNAINELIGYTGVQVDLSVEYIKLLGGNQTTTQWDNIMLYSTRSQKSESQLINAPMPPSDEDIAKVFKNIEKGKVVTLKSLLLERLNEKPGVKEVFNI